MTNAHNSEGRTDSTPQSEPAPTPLVSTADVPLNDHPVVPILDRRATALESHAHRIADHARGSPADHVTGLLGEDGVAQHLGVADSLDVEVRADGGDGGVDLHYRGATIDVKTVGRHRSDPALTVDAPDPLRADYYVLASRIGPRNVRLLGYTPRWFVANAPIRTSDEGPYHFVSQEYLFPFVTP